MMRAKADPKATSNTILGLACMLMTGAVFGLLVQKPTPKSHKSDIAKLNKSIATAASDLQTTKLDVENRTWTGEDAAITGKVLSVATALAKKRGVNFVRLQPQRATLGTPLEQLPYLLVVEGPFPAVSKLEKDLEVPENRLAVDAIQLASSDSETNKVSANITIVAHRLGADVGTKETKNGKGS